MRNPTDSIKFLSELRMRAWESAEYHARNNNDSASERARRQFDALGDAINVLGARGEVMNGDPSKFSHGVMPQPQGDASPSAQAGEVVAWQPMETAPDDGTMLRLLVDFTEHSTEDNIRAVTIGAYAAEGDPAGAWQFAGWCWTHDHFTEGKGTPVGWMPLLGDTTPQPQGDASGPSRTAAIVQALDRAAAAVLPASMRPTPQVSGGGDDCRRALQICYDALMKFAGQAFESSPPWNDLTVAVDAAHAALSTPQARPDGGAVGTVRIAGMMRWVDWEQHTDPLAALGNGTKLYTHTAPAPDVARLVEAATRLLEGVGPYFVVGTDNARIREIRVTDAGLREFREALAPFTAAQPQEEG